MAVSKLCDITGVEVLGDHRLRLMFDDGTIGDVDLSGCEWTGVLARLAEPAFFARVAVDPELGTLTWPGGLDLAPEPLYDEASRNSVEPASRR